MKYLIRWLLDWRERREARQRETPNIQLPQAPRDEWIKEWLDEDHTELFDEKSS